MLPKRVHNLKDLRRNKALKYPWCMAKNTWYKESQCYKREFPIGRISEEISF